MESAEPVSLTVTARRHQTYSDTAADTQAAHQLLVVRPAVTTSTHNDSNANNDDNNK